MPTFEELLARLQNTSQASTKKEEEKEAHHTKTDMREVMKRMSEPSPVKRNVPHTTSSDRPPVCPVCSVDHRGRLVFHFTGNLVV